MCQHGATVARQTSNLKVAGSNPAVDFCKLWRERTIAFERKFEPKILPMPYPFAFERFFCLPSRQKQATQPQLTLDKATTSKPIYISSNPNPNFKKTSPTKQQKQQKIDDVGHRTTPLLIFARLIRKKKIFSSDRSFRMPSPFEAILLTKETTTMIRWRWSPALTPYPGSWRTRE